MQSRQKEYRDKLYQFNIFVAEKMRQIPGIVTHPVFSSGLTPYIRVKLINYS
jgi:hypothetical protein